MNRLIKIYDFLSRHTILFWTSLAVTVSAFVLLAAHLDYSEDISDFLPLGTSDKEAMDVYGNISGADRLYILFSNPDDADLTVEAMDHFTETVHSRDSLGWCKDLTARFDMGKVLEVTDFVYENIPYFLTGEDYARMDSLLACPDYISDRLERDRQMLMFPTGSMAASTIVRDPLALFSPVLASLQSADVSMNFEMYDGYIFTPDMSRAIAMGSSPFGNSETEGNTKMLALLNGAIEETEAQYPGVEAHVIGGPEIAVGNAHRIKTDSIIAIALSAMLIILLAVYSIGSLRNILLIFLSIGWGWLFALGGMSLFGSQVSLIVIGIASVILGIAVNYPLHLINHMTHVQDRRTAIRDITMPLVVGNITTVGAFLTLIPLQSAALRDLGLFTSLLLVGTIVFVLIFLPHIVKVKGTAEHNSRIIDRAASFSPERYRTLVTGVAIATAVLAVFSVKTEFDSNIANINYMTDRQKEDMQYFNSLLSWETSDTVRSVYVLSAGNSFDEALSRNASVVRTIDSLSAAGLIRSHSGVSRFIVSKEEQRHRLDLWNGFVARHREELTSTLSSQAMQHGFSPDAFSGFSSMLAGSSKLEPWDIGYFGPLTQFIFSRNITQLKDSGKSYIIDIVNVEQDRMEEVKSHFDDCFDIVSMNSALSDNLSENFNYIGWACSLIVFLFLWFSFGRLELALISFIPMAVSWIWILGIMALLGIKFNIVNIILATFIFGQGDDYTIFMTEGCQHEYTYRKPVLKSYKSTILQSALIMFAGIGTLIISKHPAMHSLAEVTIIGMFSVVLMAYMIPPLLFRWLTTENGRTRKHPITLSTLFRKCPDSPAALVRGRYIYKGKKISRTVSRNLRGLETGKPDLDGKTEYSFTDNGYGETALYLALTHPETRITARISDSDRRRVAEVAAHDFADNIEFIS